MSVFQIIALLLVLTGLLSYLNYKLLKLPATIGLMVLSLGLSLGLIGLSRAVPWVDDAALDVLERIDFDATLLNGMLGFLLFAGALHVDMIRLWRQKWVVALLASVGVVLSTAIIGTATWLIFGWLGQDVPYLYCLLFGSLISPTDPIAVLAILKTLGVPESLETKIAGESLFNDGVGVVLFLALMGVAGFGGHGHGNTHAPQANPPAVHAVDTGHNEHASASDLHDEPDAHAQPEAEVHARDVMILFAQEAIGGAVFGLVVGLIAFLMLRSVDNYQVEVMISLGLVAGGYALAAKLGLSGPIAVVVSGLLIGNQGRAHAMSDRTRHHLDQFWELIDEVLNAVLFVLIGLEVLLLTFDQLNLTIGLLAIPVVLCARFIAVSTPVTVLRRFRTFTPHAIKVLAWGGLRGGISVALALSLKESLGSVDPVAYEAILFMTYAVVVFSIVVQGLSISVLLRRVGLTQNHELTHN